MRVQISDLQRSKRGSTDHDPVDFYDWVNRVAGSAEALYMRANDAIMDEVWVIVEPPGLYRSFINTFQRWMAGIVTVTIREA